jgi:hypothetical protein
MVHPVWILLQMITTPGTRNAKKFNLPAGFACDYLERIHNSHKIRRVQ